MLPSEVERFLGIKTHHSNLTGMNTQNQWSSFNYGCFGYLCIILGRISWVLPSCPFPLLHKYHKGELHKGPNLSNISNDSILPTDFTRNFPSMLKKDHPRNPQDFFCANKSMPGMPLSATPRRGCKPKNSTDCSWICECLVVG